MEFYVPATLVAFLLGAAAASIAWFALFGVLVFLALRAKAHRERESEPEIKDILYVDSAGSDANDGRSTETAVATLKTAVDVATEDDCIVVFCGSDEGMLHKNERNECVISTGSSTTTTTKTCGGPSPARSPRET